MNNLLFPLTSCGPPASAAASKGARPHGTRSCISVFGFLSLSLFIGGQNQVIDAIYLVCIILILYYRTERGVLPSSCGVARLRKGRSEAHEVLQEGLWLEFLNLVINMMNKILYV